MISVIGIKKYKIQDILWIRLIRLGRIKLWSIKVVCVRLLLGMWDIGLMV